MLVDSADGDDEPLGHFLVREATCDERQHVDLPARDAERGELRRHHVAAASPGDRCVHVAQRVAAAGREVVEPVAFKDRERRSQPRLGLTPAGLGRGGRRKQTHDRSPEPPFHAGQPRIRLGEQDLGAFRFALPAGGHGVRGQRHHSADGSVGGERLNVATGLGPSLVGHGPNERPEPRPRIRTAGQLPQRIDGAIERGSRRR